MAGRSRNHDPTAGSRYHSYLARGALNERYPDAPIGHAIRRGLTPITIGLVFASSTILMRTVNHDWRGYLITLLTVAVVLRKSWNPLWLFAGGALAGILGFV